MPTLAVMRAKVKSIGDFGDTVANSEIDATLNDELSSLHELLANSFQDYAVTSTQLTIDANTDTEPLPATFFKARGVEDDASDDEPLKRFNWEDRKRVGRLSYCIHGSNLIIRPIANVNRVFNLWFVPVYTELTADGDTFTCPNRWHRLAEFAAAATLMSAQEKDTSRIDAKADKVRGEIIAAASQRDAGDPGKARDVRGRRTFKRQEFVDEEIY
jgi:hypothetical protein